MSPTRALSFFRAKFTGYIMENNKTHKEKEIYTMIKLKQLEVTNENICLQHLEYEIRFWLSISHHLQSLKSTSPFIDSYCTSGYIFRQ